MRAAAREDTREVVLAGTRMELSALATAVSSGTAEVSVAGDSVGGYDTPCQRISVQTLIDKFVSVDCHQAVIRIVGALEKLNVLSKNIADLAVEGVIGEHLHIDYFPGHFYLGPSTWTLVISLDPSDGPEVSD